MDNIQLTVNGGVSQSNAGTSGSSGDGTAGEEENQDSDEPSSSLSSSPARKNFELELDSFRHQWKRELENMQLDDSSRNENLNDGIQEEILKQAKLLFFKGIQEERSGRLYEAISFYRRAIQLVPDIEFRLGGSQDQSEQNSTADEDISESRDSDFDSETEDEEKNSQEDFDIEDLLGHIQSALNKSGTQRICKPSHKQQETHISKLPPEVLNYILKWVVTEDLDCHSLEQVSKVCRGFFVAARDFGLWRLACLKVFGGNCGNYNKYGSWRKMFVYRPHLWFHGAYISKTTYVRYGESSFQDSNYRPCYIVEYYRYLRFFPEGLVLMLTTPDNPYHSLPKLRQRRTRHSSVMSGHYKLVGSSVVAVLKRPITSENHKSSGYGRFRRQRLRQIVGQEAEENFHIEMDIQSVKHRPNFKLIWNHYSLHTTYRNCQETVSNIDINPPNFPPFWFSRVRSYNSDVENPLQ